MDELRSQIRRQASALLRHKWTAILLAWLICLIGWAGVALIPNRFEANARVYIDADAVLTPLLHGIALDDPLAAQIEVLQRTLLSRPNLEKLIAKTDLSLELRQPTDLEEMVGRLGTEIAVVPQTRNLFTITYRNTSPRLAYDVVRTILGIFVEDKAGTSRTDMANASSFLEQQISGYERQLREAETKRAEFRARYVDLLPDETSGTSRLDEARSALRRLEGQLADAQSKHARLLQELGVTPPSLITETDPGTTAGGAATPGLAAAEARLRELQATLTDQHPEVIAQRQVVDALRRGGPGASTPGRPAHNRSEPNLIYQQLKVMLVETDSDIAALTRQVADARTERDRLEQIARSAPTVQAQSINLNRDYEVLRKNYDELLSRREAMRLASAADTQADKVKLQVVDPPQVPKLAVWPKRGLLFTLVLIAGLGGGVASAVLLSQLDNSFRSINDLRALGLPVAGSISLLAERVRPGRAWGLIGSGIAVITLLLLGVAYGGLIVAFTTWTGFA